MNRNKLGKGIDDCDEQVLNKATEEYIKAIYREKYWRLDAVNPLNTIHKPTEPCEDSTKDCPVANPKHYVLFPDKNIEVRDLMLLLSKQLDDKEYPSMLISDYIQAMQYVLRWHNKNGVEDIKKAIWYFNKMLEQLGENL